jgi:hypothetical protein
MKEQFHDYLFHFNPYEGKWFAFKREDNDTYFNDRLNCNTLSSRNIKDLISIIDLNKK